MPGRRKSLTGTVVSDRMDKTVVVVVETTTRHRLYRKILRRSQRYLVHDDRLEAKPGDLVRILETRPLSRRKRWRVAEILQRGEVAEIAPREIDSEYLGRPRERQEVSVPETPVGLDESAAVEEAPEVIAPAAVEETAEPEDAIVPDQPAAVEELPAALEEAPAEPAAEELEEPQVPGAVEEPAAPEDAIAQDQPVAVEESPEALEEAPTEPATKEEEEAQAPGAAEGTAGAQEPEDLTEEREAP
jgi:small subunit ribosomal protein S17